VPGQFETPHNLLNEAPGDVIRRLPQIGRLMIINSREGVTHERIGLLESISNDGDRLTCHSTAHDCRIHVPTIAKMVVDTSSVMNEKAYPRIDFYDAESKPMFSAVSFEGLAPFMAAIDNLKTQPYTEASNPFDIKERSEALPNDPGLLPLNAAVASASLVTIAIERPGFSQKWHGVIEKLIPSMGFINVMVPDFHFHLRAGAVGHWQKRIDDNGATLSAHDQDGAPLGLILSSASARAFETVEAAN
jgi:putative heme degradation protein